MASELSVSILMSLRGQSIILPDLNSIFQDWPKEVNPGLGQLRRDVDEWLDRYNTNPITLKASTDIVLIFWVLSAPWATAPNSKVWKRLTMLTLAQHGGRERGTIGWRFSPSIPFGWVSRSTALGSTAEREPTNNSCLFGMTVRTSWAWFNDDVGIDYATFGVCRSRWG